MLQDTEIASRQFGLEGVEVVEVDAEADGTVTVWVVTNDPLAALCPGCGVAAGVKEQIAVAPADVDLGCGRARVVGRYGPRFRNGFPCTPMTSVNGSVAYLLPPLRPGRSLCGHYAVAGLHTSNQQLPTPATLHG